MGIKDILSPEAMIRGYIRSQGWQAGRLDYDLATGTLWLSLMIRNQVRHAPIPLGRTFTIDQISSLISTAIADGQLAELLEHRLPPAPAAYDNRPDPADTSP